MFQSFKDERGREIIILNSKNLNLFPLLHFPFTMVINKSYKCHEIPIKYYIRTPESLITVIILVRKKLRHFL